MYRHYQLLPPQDKFTDGMERKLSLNTILEKIDLCHRSNMAALAYGAVYGAEPEFFKEHPDLALYNGKGAPESIGNLFYIMDIRKESPWHDLIISEAEAATLFTTAAIFAGGGFHLPLGEKDGALCGPYYPK